MFAYCENDPVNRSDPNGEFGVETIVGAVVGACLNMASYYMSNGSNSTLGGFLVAGGLGAVSGAFLAESVSWRVLGAVIQGVYTAHSTEGSLKQKLVCGGVSAFSAFCLGTGAGKIGNAFTTIEEKLIGNTIVNNTFGALNDSINRITQYAVQSNGSKTSSRGSRGSGPASSTVQIVANCSIGCIVKGGSRNGLLLV